LTFVLLLSAAQFATIQKPVSILSVSQIPEVARQTAVASVPTTIVSTPKVIHEEVPLEAIPDPHPVSIPLTERPPDWILSGAMWKDLGKFPIKFDCAIDRGQPFLGMRFVIPFGG
jgi:hypothetical protein